MNESNMEVYYPQDNEEHRQMAGHVRAVSRYRGLDLSAQARLWAREVHNGLLVEMREAEKKSSRQSTYTDPGEFQMLPYDGKIPNFGPLFRNGN